MPRKPAKKTIDFEKARQEIKSDIELWLEKEKKERDELKLYEISDFRHEDCWNAVCRYSAMAQALFLAGKNIGVITDEDLPQMAPKPEARNE